MKRFLFLFIIVLLLASNVFAQKRWGKRISLGDAFSDADSISLTVSSIRDTMTNADTLYSNALDISDRSGGYAITFFADTVSGTPTFTVYARLFYLATPSGEHWGDWNTVFSGVSAEQLQTKSYSRDGISWWMEANKVQYMIVQNGTGKAIPYLGDYVQ